jgi:hypothetical protein
VKLGFKIALTFKKHTTTRRFKMTKYTYSDQLYSDFYKDVYGFRPSRDDSFYAASPKIKQAMWDELGEMFERNQKIEEMQKTKSVENFKEYLNHFDSYSEAVNNIVEFNDFQHPLDVEHYVWSLDILFTDFGKTFLKDLMNNFEKSYDPANEIPSCFQ